MTQLPLFDAPATRPLLSCIHEKTPCRAVMLPPYTSTVGCVQTPWVCDCGMAGHYSEKAK